MKHSTRILVEHVAERPWVKVYRWACDCGETSRPYDVQSYAARGATIHRKEAKA
jgi:hypothetical protein